MSKSLNFMNPEAVTEALHARLDAQGEFSVLRKIRDAHRRPMADDPLTLAKGVPASRVQDPNADDAVSKDEDEDDEADLDENEDLHARRKARKDADRKLRSNADAARRAVAKIHAQGAQPEDPDFASMPVRYRDSRPSVEAIKRAQANPLTMQKLFAQGNGNHPIDMDAVQRIITEGQRTMRKSAGVPGDEWRQMTWPQRLAAMGKGGTSVPAQSSNATWSRQLPDTGAMGAINRDQPAPSQPFAGGTLGGFTDSGINPNDARIRAAIASVNEGDKDTQVAAIQMDWKKAKERMAASFASRPAALVDDTQKGTSLAALGRQVGDGLRKALASRAMGG